MNLWHGDILLQIPSDNAVIILYSLESYIRFQFVNPFVIWECLRQFCHGSDFCPSEHISLFQYLLNFVSEYFIREQRWDFPWFVPIYTLTFWADFRFPLPF